MPNFASGIDVGTILSSPHYNDTFQANVGPYLKTRNGLERINTGSGIGDRTSDILDVCFRKILANLDITVTTNDLSVPSKPLTVVLRGSDGSISADSIKAKSLSLSEGLSGTIYGGTW